MRIRSGSEDELLEKAAEMLLGVVVVEDQKIFPSKMLKLTESILSAVMRTNLMMSSMTTKKRSMARKVRLLALWLYRTWLKFEAKIATEKR